MNFVKTIPKWAEHNPPFAIIPLGTGNDLSRSLGWGGSTEDEINAPDLLQEIAVKGKHELLDRWKMTISGEENQEFTVYNYIGIGLDAKICRHFHHLREKYPQLFFSQFSNKLIYTQIGSLDIFGQRDRMLHLSKNFDMTIDGQPVSVEHYENLVLLNIHHWGGGVTDLWKSKTNGFAKDSFSDGLLEVIGLSDILHMGQVQVGMDEPFQVGQGRVIRFKSKEDNQVIPLQIDGEPIQIITPCEIVIERKDQVNVLATTPTDSGAIYNFLKRALLEHCIQQPQFEALVALSKRNP
jgi:diacylglycerol kinase (ATP)